MKDNLSIVITIIVLVMLIVIFPLYNYFERQDDMSYNLVLKATTNFVDEVLNSGYIDQSSYDKFVNTIAATGNLYDIELEAHRKVLTKNPDNTSANEYIEQYVIDYNDQIFEDLTTTTANVTSLDHKTLKTGTYLLNEGDQFYIKLKNSNKTMAGAIFNTIVPTSKTDRIAVNYGGIVKNNAWQEVASVYLGYDANSNKPQIITTPTIQNNGIAKPGIIHFDVKLPDTIIESNVIAYEWRIIYSDGYMDVKTGSKAIDYNFTNMTGTYSVEIKVTDQLGDSVISNPLKFTLYKPNMVPPVIITNPYVANGSTINPQTINFSISNNTDVSRYAWTITNAIGTTVYSSSNSTMAYNFSAPGKYTIKITIYNVYNEPMSASMSLTIPMAAPIIYASPDVINGDAVVPVGTTLNFRAESPNPGNGITVVRYEWKITYPNGTIENKTTTSSAQTILVNANQNGAYAVQVHAVDSTGAVSKDAVVGFFALSSGASNRINSVGESTLQSIEIPGTIITQFTFNVFISNGHSGNDSWRVEGYSLVTNRWEIIASGDVRNGISLTNYPVDESKKYSTLKFTYKVDTGHASCLTSGSSISYTVKYKGL